MTAQQVSLHEPRAPRWLGDKRQFQREAQLTYARELGRIVRPWSWVSLTCDWTDCLDPNHMVVHSPTHIDYPAGICVYCGNPSGSRDHLLARGMTGEAQRRLIAVVPACVDCNNRINDAFAVSVTERREIAHLSIAKKYRNVLSVPDKTADDLRELGPAMRSVAIKNNELRAYVRSRLAWPLDPHYDLRAFQRSGIEDPAGLGLI